MKVKKQIALIREFCIGSKDNGIWLRFSIMHLYPKPFDIIFKKDKGLFINILWIILWLRWEEALDAVMIGIFHLVIGFGIYHEEGYVDKR